MSLNLGGATEFITQVREGFKTCHSKIQFCYPPVHYFRALPKPKFTNLEDICYNIVRRLNDRGATLNITHLQSRRCVYFVTEYRF